MDLNNIPLMNMLQTKMSYGAARQEVISQNIANVNTPDYKRRDINKPSFKGMVKSSMLSMETTDPQHIGGTDGASNFAAFTSDKPVELDMEAIELAKNYSDYEKASTIYKKMISLMNQAAGSNK